MGKRGPKPVPVQLRELHGNPRRTPLPVDVPNGTGELWAPPDWFNVEQRAQWDYAVEHAPQGLLTGTDREVLVVWCVAAVEHALAVVQVRRLGQVVKSADGSPYQNPFLGIVNRQALIMLRAGAEMGFSPASRTALGSSLGEIGNGSTSPTRPSRSRLAQYLAQKPDRRLDS